MDTDEKLDTCDPNQLWLSKSTEQVFCCSGNCNEKITWVNWYGRDGKITKNKSMVCTHNSMRVDERKEIVKLSDEEFFLRFVIKG